MSPTTRFRPQSQGLMTASSPNADNGPENAVRKACDLLHSTDPAHIQRAWQNLRRAHRVARRDRHKLKAFPYWVLESVPSQIILLMLEAEYGIGARRLHDQGPVVFRKFKVPEWYFALFPGCISQHIARSLVAIARKKPESLSIDSLYRKVKQKRDEPLKDNLPSSSGKELQRKPSENVLGFKLFELTVRQYPDNHHQLMAN